MTAVVRKINLFESLETRRLMAWSNYAELVDQDVAAASFSSITGAGVTVAVIDTGIDYSLSMLGGGIGEGHKVIAGKDWVDDDDDPMDEDGHGTAVASLIAADPYTVSDITYQGVAPDANLVALRVGTEESIPDANIEDALQWVIANYQTYHISVVNLSLGSGNFADSRSNSTMSDEFATLRGLGIFVTAASGNSGDQNAGPISQDGVAYPAADPNVFAVGAVSASDSITTWTQRGDELDLLAPGVGLVMPKVGGGFVTEDGTSFASPYVAGTAALIKQADPGAKAGDIGSILMSSGTDNRDGDNESGNTTGLLFSRLDIDNALTLAAQRKGRYTSVDFGKLFDTAVDSQGVLHASWFEPANGDLLYATRNTSGKWSGAKIIDADGIVGSQSSIAVDASGKIGIGYFDNTHTDIKYAGFNGSTWSTTTIDSKNHVGTSPSLAFSIDGDAYLAYFRRASGDVKMATLNRDSNRWSRQTIDGTNGANVGNNLSLDVGEAALRSGQFTVYDTTVAIAYADTTHGDLKYARIDVDDTAAEWFISVVDNTTGVSNIDLDLHAGPSNLGLQAQIGYRDNKNADVKYAYRNTDWFVETVASAGNLGPTVQLYFDGNNTPEVVFFDTSRRALYTSRRTGTNQWSMSRVALSAAPMTLAANERSGAVFVTYQSRNRTAVLSTQLI
jgi:hypothetical protein